MYELCYISCVDQDWACVSSKIEFDVKFGRCFEIYFSLVDTPLDILYINWIPKP